MSKQPIPEFNPKKSFKEVKSVPEFDPSKSFTEKKNAIQNGSQTISEPLPFGSKPFQTQVDTKVPSVLTAKGKVSYGEEVKKKAQQKQKLSDQLNIAKSAFASAQGEDVARDIEMYQQDPESFRKVEAGSWLGNAIKQGLLTGELANSLPTGGVPSTPEDLSRVADINYQIERIPQSEAQKEYQKSGLKVFKNPLLGAQFLTETLASSFAGLYESAKRTVPLATTAGAGLGAFAGGIGALPGAGLGVMGGLSVAGLNLSTSADIMQSLRDSGVDVTDKDALIKAFSDKNKMSEIRTNALKYGVPIMVVDMATAGIAGKLIGGTAGKSIAKKIGAGLGEAGIQAVGGSTGELSGQYISGKKIDWNDVAIEGIASLATDAPDVAIGAMTRDKSSSSNKNIVTQINKFGAEEGAIDARINLDRDLANGTITPDEYEQGINFIEKAVVANEKIPIGIEGENREKSIELIAKKDDILLDIEELNKQKEGIDDSFYPVIDEQIKSKESEVESINKGVQELAKLPVEPIAAQPTQEDVLITPETSSNYANMTEDDKGNFVFFHVGGKGYDKIKPGTGASTVTSREEAAALSKVGGLGMYYTDPNQEERQSAAGTKYAVKIPKEKVYDFNTDKLNFIEEAKARHEAENPGKAFDVNSQLAYVTKIAGENGFDMVVAQWNNMTRAQTTKELTPTDIQESEGNVIKKAFNEKYESNKKKGFEPVVPVAKSERLATLYDKINKIRNKEKRYDDLYRLYADSNKLEQDNITELINESDLPQEIKDEYRDILESKEETRRSQQTKPKQEVTVDALKDVESTAKALDLKDKSIENLDNVYNELSRSKNKEVRALANMVENIQEKNERNSVLNTLLENINKTIDEILKQDSYFLEKREAIEAKEVANKYLGEVSKQEAKKDFKDAFFGNPNTWVADALKMREAVRVYIENAGTFKELLSSVKKEFESDGFTEQDAANVIKNKLDSLVKKDFRQQQISEAYHKAKADGSNPELVKAVENLLNPKQDAVQVETAGQVPVLTEAPTGKEVEQGKPKSKVEGVTEEGGKEEVVIDKESIVKNSAKELERVKSANRESEDGATFNIDGTKYEGVGLVIPVTSLNTTINKINPQMLADFVEKNKNKIGDMDTVKFGIYKFPNSNQISIDLNIIASEKFKDQAIEFGRLAGQESLFDLETYENVKTGSDGKNPIDFTDTQFKEISKALKDGRIPNVFAKEEVDTKQQIEDFGVAKNQVESVNSVISQVFDGLKKAGLTTAKNVGEWIGISKGSKVKNALFQPTYYGESGIVKKPSFDEKSADESIKSGRVKIVSPIDSLSDLSFSVTRPDDLFVGDIFHNGKKIGSFDGGVFYPLNGGENGKMWASVSAGAASGFSNQANRSLLINNGINLPKGFEGETLSYKKGALKNEWVAVNKKSKEFSFILPDNPKQGVVVITKGDSLKHKTSLSGKIGFVNTLLSYAKGKDGYNGLIDAIKSVYSIGSLKDVDSLIKLFNNYLKEGRMADGKTMDEAKTSYDNFRSALISKANPIITKMMRDMGYDGVEYFDGTQLKKGIYKATGKGIDEMFKDLGQEDFLKGLKNDDAYAALKITSPTMFEKDISHPSYPYVIKTVDGSPVGLDIFNKTFRTTGENIGDMANKDRSISQAAPQVTTTLPKYKLNQKIDLSGPLSTDLSGVLDKYESVSRTQSLKQGANAQYRIESGKNIIEALKNFNGSQKAIVAITHEIMHPTVVAIIDGAKDGNEVGLRHTKTIVEEFNKANPKNKVTVEQLIDGNDIFKSGTTSNQYRAVQEFIAKSWEKYHKEGGKGFSAAFQEVLSQITEAFKSVYKSISGKKLTPELRKMFDEILGKDITKEPELNELNVESAIELLDDIEDNRRKSERASSKRKAELDEKIAKSETELYKISDEAQIVKAINDNFDKIKKDLKEQGLLNVKC